MKTENILNEYKTYSYEKKLLVQFIAKDEKLFDKKRFKTLNQFIEESTNDEIEKLIEIIENVENQSEYNELKFHYMNREYIVGNYKDIKYIAKEKCKEYIEDCILDQIPQEYRGYFDDEMYIRDYAQDIFDNEYEKCLFINDLSLSIYRLRN